MAIVRFRVYWEEDESVYRDILIRHKASFEVLQREILKSYEFDNKHQSTFYRSNDHWKKGRQIVMERYDMVYKAEPLIMADTTIGSEIKDPHQKFVFVYDFSKEWTFYLEVIGINKDDDEKTTPACVRSVGIGPSQYGTKALVEKRLAQEEEKYHQQLDEMPEDYDEEDKNDENIDGGGDENEDREDNPDENIDL